jgi:hypothetical protein
VTLARSGHWLSFIFNAAHSEFTRTTAFESARGVLKRRPDTMRDEIREAAPELRVRLSEEVAGLFPAN